MAKPLFPLGQTVATPAAMEAVLAAGQNPAFFLVRHVTGDWGLVDAEDAKANEDALKDGSRLLSVYETAKGVRVWVITEADRSVTTILLPEDY
jgi:hypothetical protein